MAIVSWEESLKHIQKMIESWGLPGALTEYIQDIDVHIGTDCVASATVTLLLRQDFDIIVPPNVHYNFILPVGFEMIDSVTEDGNRRIRVEKVGS